MDLRSRVTTDLCVIKTKTVVQKWGDITLWHHGSRPTPGQNWGDTFFFTSDVVPSQWLSMEIGWQPVFYSCRLSSMTQHRTRVTDLFLIKVVGSVKCLTQELGWQSPIVKCPILHNSYVLTLDIFLPRVWGRKIEKKRDFSHAIRCVNQKESEKQLKFTSDACTVSSKTLWMYL